MFSFNQKTLSIFGNWRIISSWKRLEVFLGCYFLPLSLQKGKTLKLMKSSINLWESAFRWKWAHKTLWLESTLFSSTFTELRRRRSLTLSKRCSYLVKVRRLSFSLTPRILPSESMNLSIRLGSKHSLCSRGWTKRREIKSCISSENKKFKCWSQPIWLQEVSTSRKLNWSSITMCQQPKRARRPMLRLTCTE